MGEGGGGGERPRGGWPERRKKGSEPRTSVEMCSGLRVLGTGAGKPEDEGGRGADASRGWEAGEGGACGDRRKKGSERRSLLARETGGTEGGDTGAGTGSTGGGGG